MEVDEISHAVGEVLVGAPVSDFHPAPGSMGVEEDEEIDRAIAAIFAVVTFELSRLGRDWRSHFTDQLRRAFVEAYNWPVWIGGLRLEIEHILHAGDIFAVDLGNAPHVFAPRL